MLPEGGRRFPGGDATTAGRHALRGFTLVELLIVVAIIGLIAAIAIPNLMNAIEKGRQKRTMSDLRTIGTGVEAYAVDQVVYPTAGDAAALRSVLEPKYVTAMPMSDAWSHAVQVDSTAGAYTIYSQGKDGTGNDCSPGATSTFDAEICFSGGQFRRYPSGVQQ
jgi:type II secretion system protein G